MALVPERKRRLPGCQRATFEPNTSEPGSSSHSLAAARYKSAVMALAVGDPVPDFELPVRGKESAKLSTALQSGPVVLLTYILDWSPG
jgi:hypothetical protein